MQFLELKKIEELIILYIQIHKKKQCVFLYFFIENLSRFYANDNYSKDDEISYDY